MISVNRIQTKFYYLTLEILSLELILKWIECFNLFWSIVIGTQESQSFYECEIVNMWAFKWKR